jgi:hypothetical protein
VQLALDELEGSHLCLDADLVRRISEREPFLADSQASASGVLAGAPVFWMGRRQKTST